MLNLQELAIIVACVMVLLWAILFLSPYFKSNIQIKQGVTGKGTTKFIDTKNVPFSFDEIKVGKWFSYKFKYNYANQNEPIRELKYYVHEIGKKTIQCIRPDGSTFEKDKGSLMFRCSKQIV